MRSRVFRAVLALVVLGGVAMAFPTLATGDPSQVGQWGAPFAQDPLFAERPPQTIQESLETPPAVSMAVLPNGRILYWGGLEGLEDSAAPLAADAGRSGRLSRSRILDIRSGTPSWSVPDPETGGADDMFCADLRLLISGKVIAAGGTVYKNDPVDLTPVTGSGGPGGTAELFGSSSVRTFDPSSDQWTVGSSMNYGRWYPTLVTLPNGKLFIASGVERLIYNTKGENVTHTELFDPATGSWTDNGDSGALPLPLFSRMHLLPDGKVFYDGSGQMWSPAGETTSEATWNWQYEYDPATNSWAKTGIGSYGARSGTLSVMLPLKAPYDSAQILLAGGTLGTSPGSYVAGTYSELITVVNGTSSSTKTGELNNRRWYSSGVLLPDGSVVALSGADKDEVIAPGTESPVHQAEIFSNGVWKPLSSGLRDRTYHNTAVLLADGSILVGGHSPINSLYGPKGDNSLNAAGGSNNLKDPSFEIFKPPYLFRGTRPSISSVQKGVGWGETFSISTPESSGISKVVLVRLPSTTHVTDADMRAVELPFQATSGTSIEATAPPNVVAPPGFYYLFILRDNGSGLTPSTARIVKVGQSEGGVAPAPMGWLPQ